MYTCDLFQLTVKTREIDIEFNYFLLWLHHKNPANSRFHKLFATMFHQRNMRESTHTGDTPQACFLLEKPNTFLDSSVGRAPDC